MLSENTILQKAVGVLRERLPPGWSVELSAVETGGDSAADGVLRIASPDGRSGEVVVEVKSRLDPHRVSDIFDQLKKTARGRSRLAVAPWISSTTRALLVECGINLLDLTGNLRLVLAEPGLFVDTPGALHDPWPETSNVTLSGAKAARIVRALCAARPPVGVRQLAALADTTPGYVSKLLSLLDRLAAVERTASGQVARVDLRRLLVRHAEDAPLDRRATRTSFIDPRGLTALMEKLRKAELRYAVTGSFAAARRAPVTAPRVVSMYVDDPEVFATAVGLRPADSGANVLVLVPDDDLVFEGVWEEDGIHYAALPQVAADLLSGPGRGPAEADALLEWMTKQPEVWRG